MGDDELPAVERQATPDRAAWTPRHRSPGRGGRARKDRPPPEPAEDPVSAEGSADDRPAPDPSTRGVPVDASNDVVPTGAAPSDAAPPAIDEVAEEPAVGIAVVPAERSSADAAVVMPTQALPVAPSTVDSDEHAWLDQDAGPVVRPYTLTGGRSRPFTSGLDLLTHVEALYAPDADLVALQPEQRAILTLTRTATTLAELSARLDLPVGVVRVLVGDLIQANLVSTFDADAAIRAPDDDILQAVIDPRMRR